MRGVKFGSTSTTPTLGISGGATATRGPREPRRNRALRDGTATTPGGAAGGGRGRGGTLAALDDCDGSATASSPASGADASPGCSFTAYAPSSSFERSMISASCAWRSRLGNRSGSSGSAASPFSSIIVSRSSSALTGCSPPRRRSACLIKPKPSPRENPLPPPLARRPSSRRAPSAARRRGRSSRGASPRGAPVAVGWAAAPGTPGPSEISYWPLSSFLRWIRPRCAASTTNLLKREKPMSFSLNDGSISCITCFSRSERITSLCAVICFTASTTSSHGSRRSVVTSLSFVSPASSL